MPEAEQVRAAVELGGAFEVEGLGESLNARGERGNLGVLAERVFGGAEHECGLEFVQ